MTGTSLAQLAGKSLPATPTCVGTPNPTTLNFVISVIEFLFQKIYKLIAHMREIHLGSTVCTREEMIEDEQAQAHTVRQWFKEMQRKERKKKKKKKHRDDDDDDEDDDKTYHPSQDYNDDSQVDPEFRRTRRELREADK